MLFGKEIVTAIRLVTAMNGTIASLFALSFALTTAALFFLIWAISRGQMGQSAQGARVIFAPDEVGRAEDPAALPAAEAAIRGKGRQTTTGDLERDRLLQEELADRQVADRSSRAPVLAFLASAVVWLIVGSVLGVIVSAKFNFPDWLSSSALLTFGRLRPLHLNIVAYGWISMAAVGVALWLMPRLLRTPLRGGRWAVLGAGLWNLGVLGGVLAILFGWTDGTEWLEFPWQIDGLLVLGGAMAAIPLLMTLKHRRVDHLYVSVWYIVGPMFWFPILFTVANLPGIHFGVEHATVNWWFAHNVLGLWMTPLSLAASYYLIPKVLGRPIYSYQLSLIGFWALALFYSQVGIHHLIGGPLPTWLVTVSVVASMMMFVPVITIGVNYHMTLKGHFGALRHSPTLRFVVVGAMIYTLTSAQGCLEALRSVNRVTHFTHFTVAHAHMGAYAFVTMVLFGAIYFLLPRLTGWEWPYPRLIRWHFWLATVGITIYVGALTIGGLLQGFAMLDAARPFMDSVRVTLPYLMARTVGGTLMTLSHLIFAGHVLAVLTRRGPQRQGAAWLADPRTPEVTA
jgi:cytochrome c oxidase cbb3-type subunit 1